jgi:hypothetical protein
MSAALPGRQVSRVRRLREAAPERPEGAPEAE